MKRIRKWLIEMISEGITSSHIRTLNDDKPSRGDWEKSCYLCHARWSNTTPQGTNLCQTCWNKSL